MWDILGLYELSNERSNRKLSGACCLSRRPRTIKGNGFGPSVGHSQLFGMFL